MATLGIYLSSDGLKFGGDPKEVDMFGKPLNGREQEVFMATSESHDYVYDGGLLPVRRTREDGRPNPSISSSKMYRCSKCGDIKDYYDALEKLQKGELCKGSKEK